MFDVAVGERAISHMGHIKMMGAVQPFISGRDLEDGQPARRRRPSRTSPTPTSQAWRLGIKALAIYRDGSKTAQALRTDAQKDARRRPTSTRSSSRPSRKALAEAGPRRKRMPRERQSITHKFSIAGHEGYITAGHVRGRHGRRDLPHRHRQGGLDAARDDELVRDGDLDRAAVRRAARDARAEVQLHALRARRGSPATRRSRSRSRCPTTSCAGWPRASSTPTPRRSSASSRPRCARARPPRRPLRRARRHGRSAPGPSAQAKPRRRRTPREPIGGNGGGEAAARRRADRHAAGRPGAPAGPRPGPGVQPVRRHDAADGVAATRARAAATTPAAAERRGPRPCAMRARCLATRPGWRDRHKDPFL